MRIGQRRKNFCQSPRYLHIQNSRLGHVKVRHHLNISEYLNNYSYFLSKKENVKSFVPGIFTKDGCLALWGDHSNVSRTLPSVTISPPLSRNRWMTRPPL